MSRPLKQFRFPCNRTAPRPCLVLGLLCGLVLAPTSPSPAYEQQTRGLARTLCEKLGADSASHNIGVVDFTDLQGRATDLGRFLAEELSVSLIEVAPRGIRVVDRSHLKFLLAEHKLATTGLIDPSQVKKLGQIAGLDAIVTGSLTAFGDSVRLTVKMLDTTTGIALAGASVDIPRTKAINDILANVAPSLGAGELEPDGEPNETEPELTEPIEVHGVLVSISECKAQGSEVACKIVLVNTTEGDRHVGLPQPTMTFGSQAAPAAGILYDASGNDYPSSSVRLGSSRGAVTGGSYRSGTQTSYTLPSGVKISGVLAFPRVPPGTRQGDIVLSVGVNRYGTNVTFKSVRIK